MKTLMKYLGLAVGP